MPEGLLSAIHLVLQRREVKIARLNATYPKTRCAAIQQHHSASRQELARLRHADRVRRCLFIGVDRKSPADGQNGAFDPEPTYAAMTQLVASGASKVVVGWRDRRWRSAMPAMARRAFVNAARRCSDLAIRRVRAEERWGEACRRHHGLRG